MSHSNHSYLSLYACLSVLVCPVCFLWEHMDDSARSPPLDMTVNIVSCVLVFVCVQWEPACSSSYCRHCLLRAGLHVCSVRACLPHLFALLCTGVWWSPLKPEVLSPCTLTHLNHFFSFVAAEDPPGKWQSHADTHSLLCGVLGDARTALPGWTRTLGTSGTHTACLDPGAASRRCSTQPSVVVSECYLPTSCS